MSVKFNADGTLTESSAEVESTTVQRILEFVPTKELVGLAPKPSADAALAPQQMQDQLEHLQLTLTIEQKDYRHIYTRSTALQSPNDTCDP